jgi:transcriptional regulator with XRE-family HTH domain
MSPRQTALARLLQERREDAGYSRARAAELVGIKPGTIEGWELGRVAKPPLHDVLRLARFLRIPVDEIEAAVLADVGEIPVEDESRADADRSGRRGSARRRAAVQLLDAAFRLFGWEDEAAAAKALDTAPEQIRRWRTGAERMALADYLTLTSMVAIAAAEAIKGDERRAAEVSAAAQLLGLRTS